MKHLKLFFALFAMLALGVTNAWAETVEFDLTTKTQLTTQTANSVVFTNGGATLTITKSASGTAVNNYMPGGTTDASHTRVYKTNPITFDVGTGNKIQSVTVKVTSSSGAIDKITNGTWNPTVTNSGTSSPITYTLSTTSPTASVTPSGTSRIEKVTLTYVSEGGSTPEPEPDPDPTPDDSEPDNDPTPEPGGEVASYTWDLTKASYSASSTSQVTWSATDVNMVLTKESSSTNADNYLGGTNAHTRVYKDQKITFTPAANVTITSIEIISTSADYASKFASSTWSNATAAASSSNVTITPSNGANAIICTIGAATRATGVTVNYTKAASGEPEPVIVKTLTSIAVTGMKTTYEQGDIFKFNGTCTATYSVTKDGVAQANETAEVTPTSVSSPNMNTVGTQTIEVTYETVSTTYDITITENEVTPGTYNVLLDNVLWNVVSGQQAASVESMSGKANDITFYTTKGSSQMYANATQTRFYKDQTFTISVPEGYLIKSIIFAEPASDNRWDGSITVNTGTYTDGTKTWTGSAQEVTYTFGAQNRIANAEITYEVAPVEPTKTLTSIKITTPATQTTFWQGETFNYNGLVVTAYYSDAAEEVVTPTVTGSTATAGPATVNVSYKEQSTSYTIDVKAIPNTKETAYTVADAYNIIDKLTTAEGVFISGTISQIDSYSDPYKSITYWISADGTTTKQLQVYSGKGLESADFAAVTDLSVGDQVIVCGNLKKYSGTYEFDKNNYLASHTPTTKDPAGLAYATTSYTANVGEPFTTPELTNPHELDVTYSTSDPSKATVDVNTGAVTIVAAGEVTITASTTGDATHDAGSASYTITITDLSLLIATLPFEFNGKQADIEGTAGMTQSGIDSKDYADAPYLKMNTTGDWLIIRFDSEPEKLSYDIKNNSFSGGTFSVQESADGETYTDVAVHTEITETQSEEHTLSSTSRYVKFIYTVKVIGNVGLGNIKITEPDDRADAGLAWNPTSVTLTQGEAFTAPTLNKPNSVSDITYESSNDEVATVTTAGVIALGSATGTATITATFDGDATYKPATATCTITVNEYIETIDGEWELVTDASKLQAGMEIIIASVEVDGKYYAMSKASDNGNNRTAVESTISGDKLNPAVGTSVLTLVDAGNGTFALQAGNGNYLYAASSGSNYLKEKDEIDVNGQWTITIADNVATIKAEASSYRNWMQFNPNNGSPLFSCYAYDKPQKDIALYAKVPEHSRTTSAGRYGTICLPGNIVKCLGATLYEVAGREGDKVIFDEVLTPKAGMPYIFLAHNAEVLFFCGDQTAAADNHNSLYGTFTELKDGDLKDMYMVQNNKIVKCADTGCTVGENRAYFNGAELEGLGAAPAAMPGRRRVTMGTSAENTTTGTEDVVSPTDNVIKKIVDGQLIIIRDGEKFNAQGQRL